MRSNCCVKQSRIWKTGSQTQTQKVTVFAIEPTLTVSDCLRRSVYIYGKRSRTCLEIESKHNLLKLLKRKSYIRASLSFRMSFISNLRYYFPAFRCVCASCVEWRFQVKISIANSSNQRNSLSRDLSFTYVLFLNLLYSSFSILQCICEIQSFGDGSLRIGLKATKTLPSSEKCGKPSPAYLRNCCEDGYENMRICTKSASCVCKCGIFFVIVFTNE